MEAILTLVIGAIVGSVFGKLNAIRESKRSLKHEACLNALSVIDADFSHRDWIVEGKKIDDINQQEIDISKARACHSQLALSCDDPKIVEAYVNILTSQNQSPSNPTESLNELRNLIRTELGFGNKIEFNKDQAWIAKLSAAPKQQK